MPASADPSTWPGALIDEAAGARRAAAPLMPRSLFVKGGEPWASAAPPVPLDIVFTVAGTGRCHPVGVIYPGHRPSALVSFDGVGQVALHPHLWFRHSRRSS